MTTDADKRMQRLFELLLARNGRKDQLKALTERAESYSDFRVLLVSECASDGSFAEVLECWQRKVAAILTGIDGREMLHDLEVLAIKQAEIEKQLRVSEASLISNLRAVDASATELASLSSKVREVRTAISEYRKRIAELAASTEIAQERTSGLTRTSH